MSTPLVAKGNDNVQAGVGTTELANTLDKGAIDSIARLAEDEPIEDGERTFTWFPKLAPELRLKIWKFAPPGPRYIEVKNKKLCPYLSDPAHWSYLCKYYAPALFFVCHESRAFILSLYTRVQGNLPGSSAIYYSPATDVLAFRYTHVVGVYQFWQWVNDSTPEFLASIKHMAWQCREPVPSLSTEYTVYNFNPDDFFSQAHINRLSGLETLQVCKSTEQDWVNDESVKVVDGQVIDLRKRGTIVGFEEDESTTQDKKCQQLFLRAMTHVGEDWDEEPMEAVREDWVAPRAIFGGFITEG